MRIPIHQLPHISNLAKDYINNYAKLARFFNGDFKESGEYKKRMKDARTRDLPIEEMIPLLQEQNSQYGCSEKTVANINKLRESNAYAIVTGQQVGLFSGPLYTIYKTMTVIKLVERFNSKYNGCFVPIFWLASEDHDFQEINHIKLVNKLNEVTSIGYSREPGSKVPAYRHFISSKISALIEQLDNETHATEFKDNILAQLLKINQFDDSFPAAFGKWLTHLFKDFGIILIDASDARFKKLGSDFFKVEIIEKSPSTMKVIETSELLERENYHTQVKLRPGTLNLFFVDHERQTLHMHNDQLIIKESGRRFSTNEIIDLIDSQPELFSPNVILRPLYQDVLLPTVAYVAGPGEIAYYAQLKGVYERFNIPMPIIYPRKSITLLENKISTLLDKYDLKVTDCWINQEKLMNRIVKKQLPQSLDKKLFKALQRIVGELNLVKDEISLFEPTLLETIEGVKGKIQHQFDFLEKKILQAYKNRNDILRQHINKMTTNLYPENQLQERSINIIPFLFKYGDEFIYQLYRAMDISDYDHQVIQI